MCVQVLTQATRGVAYGVPSLPCLKILGGELERAVIDVWYEAWIDRRSNAPVL